MLPRSIRKERHRESLFPTEQNGARHCRRSESPAHFVERKVEGAAAEAIERQHELKGAVVLEIAHGYADERQASAFDLRHCAREQPASSEQNRVRVRNRLRQCVRPRRPREIAEAQSQHDRAADTSGDAHSARDTIDERDEDGVHGLGRLPGAAERALRTDRAPAATEYNRPRITVVSERIQMPARRPAEDRHEHGLG